MIVGLAFLTIQHLDFTPAPQPLSDEDLSQQSRVLQPDTQSEHVQQRDISILESQQAQTETSSEINAPAGNRALSDAARDSLYLSQFGTQ